MPNTTSAPTASSERTSDCAPVTRTGVPAGGAGFGRAPGTPGAVGPGFASLRDVALVIGSASWVLGVTRSGCLGRTSGRGTGFTQQKTLADRKVARGSRVDAEDSS
ncbi:hypothetical protein GCM10027360_57220 [Amycolatopsis echigonensis]